MGNIVVIGPRGSGKTTYLTGLAYWQIQNKNSSFKVQPLNDDAMELQGKAENILIPQSVIEPTRPTRIEVEPVYSFQIEIKRGWQIEKLNFVARDYSGELFKDLANLMDSNGSLNLSKLEETHIDYWQECFTDKVGCLLMLSDWLIGVDRFYSRSIAAFAKLMDQYNKVPNFRVAVAMSKCERGELWPGRIEPEIDLFNLHLPKTKSTLQQSFQQENLGFFALSTFGVLGRNNPRPNRQQDPTTKESMLREPGRWRPYNLIAPLYWLSTGKRISPNVR